MSTISENLRTYVLADPAIDAAIGGRMEKSKSSKENAGLDRIVYFRDTGPLLEPDLAGEGIPSETFTVECISRYIQNVEEWSVLVRERLEGHAGVFGDGCVQAVFVEDVDDSYIARGIESDEGSHVVAFTVEIIAC